MDLLEDRKKDEDIIFRAHVERVLKHHANKIDDAINKVVGGFSTDAFSKRTFTADDTSLSYRHAGLLRFVDMKRLARPGTQIKYRRKSVHEAHNRIIMGHFNGIMGDLIYGLTEEVKAELKAKLDNKTI